MRTNYITLVCFILLLCTPLGVDASVISQALREASEQAFKLFGKKTGAESAEALAQQSARIASKYGDEAESIVVKALRKPQFVELIGKYGDEVFEGIVRHGDNADVLITQYGDNAALALAKVEKRQGRYLTALHKGDELAQIGGADKVFDVVAKFGNKGADFIWKNKLLLAGGVVAVTFYNNPEPFIDGIKDLASEVAKSGAAGVANVGNEFIRNSNKTLLTLLIIGIPVIFVLLLFRRPIWRLLFQKKEKS